MGEDVNRGRADTGIFEICALEMNVAQMYGRGRAI